MAPSGILAASIPSLSFLLVCSLAPRSVNGMEGKGMVEKPSRAGNGSLNMSRIEFTGIVAFIEENRTEIDDLDEVFQIYLFTEQKPFKHHQKVKVSITPLEVIQ